MKYRTKINFYLKLRDGSVYPTYILKGNCVGTTCISLPLYLVLQTSYTILTSGRGNKRNMDGLGCPFDSSKETYSTLVTGLGRGVRRKNYTENQI